MTFIFEYFTVLMYLTVLSLDQSIDALQTCPCRIDTSKEEANCSYKSLNSVPACVPSSTQNIILSNNIFRELYPRQFERFRDLIFLDLSSNCINQTSDESFKGLSELAVLDLGSNNLQVLNRSLFTGLSSLQNLTLRRNELSHITEYSLNGLFYLTYLNLEINRLEYLSRNTFNGLSALKILILDDNPLRFATSLPSEIFHPLVSLEELHVKGLCRPGTNCTYLDTQLSKVPSLKRLYMNGLPNQSLGSGFAKLKNLEELYMGDIPYGFCFIKVLRRKIFENLENIPLVKLSLKDCDIERIFLNAFVYLKFLTTLDMSGNFKLSHKCRECTLENLTTGLQTTRIKYLNISGIYIGQYLSRNDVRGLMKTDLESLDLSKCSIINIDDEIYLSLPKSLKHLYLRYNYIHYIDLQFLNVLENLLTLDLSNQIGKPPTQKKENLNDNNDALASSEDNVLLKATSKRCADKHQIKTKTIPGNVQYYSTSNISTLTEKEVRTDFDSFDFRLQLTNIKNNCSILPRRLQLIDVSYSDLIYLIFRMCESKNDLRVLNAAYQNHYHKGFIKNLWKVLNKFPRLEELDVSGNFIKDLPRNICSHNPQLKRLLLSENSLVHVNFDVQPLRLLNKLDLSNNRIQYVSRLFTTQIERLAKFSNLTLYLQNNILVCKCDRIDFAAWLLHTKMIFEKDSLMCEFKNDSQVSISRISEIHTMLQMECITFQVVAGCGFGFIILTLLISLIAITYYKRWKFRYLLFVGRRNVNPYHPLEDCKVEMEYDVYISYERDYCVTCSETLHEFVTQKLCPRLRNRGFQVLIREELDIGKKLYDVISQALRKSRNVIVLLSNDYCIDYWNVFEFNMAAMEGIYTKRLVVIPVMLEALEPADLHEEVYTYLKSEPVPKIACISERDKTILTEYLSERLR